MKVYDKLYGKKEIREGVLLDLINSKPVQRLKKVSQLGMPDEYYFKRGYSRYKHSLGVLLLLKHLGASLEEQVAGLLHDVSHTAFSHVVDWIVGDPTKEDYQDKSHLKIIKTSEIPKILSFYGFDWKRVSDITNFSLLEREAPDLCADRIDYALREFEIQDIKINRLVEDLVNFNNEIYFRTFDSADFFARGYVSFQRDHWAGNQARSRYHLLSDILKKAIEEKIITLKDLSLKGDYEIIGLLKKSTNHEIISGLDLLRNGFKIEEVKEGGIVLEKKFRHVDPKILINGTGKRLSEISLDYRVLLDKERENSKISKQILIK
jgi:HD superfamily phosphohydrolase